jgi:hypothetical protein
MADVEDRFRACVEGTGDVEGCLLTRDVLGLIEGMDLAECVRTGTAEECFVRCVEKCGEECTDLCLAAVSTAAGIAKARNLMEDIALAASAGVGPLDAAAAAVVLELRKAVEVECPDRAAITKTLTIMLIELKNLLRSKEVLLLLAPLLAVEHTCVGDAVYEFLEAARQGIGEDLTKRIVAALEEGAVKVGNSIIRFPPVRHL